MVRRDSACVLIATSQELADDAFRLGQCADRLAAEDPLAPPARMLQTLQALVLPTGATELADTRLVRLAAAASAHAAVSSRQELYPMGGGTCPSIVEKGSSRGRRIPFSRRGVNGRARGDMVDLA